MQLADPTVLRTRRLAGMEQLARRTLEGGLELQRRVELLGRPLRLGEPAVDDGCDVPALVRELAARTVRARDLEQRHLRRSDGNVAPRRLDEALGKRRAHRC